MQCIKYGSIRLSPSPTSCRLSSIFCRPSPTSGRVIFANVNLNDMNDMDATWRLQTLRRSRTSVARVRTQERVRRVSLLKEARVQQLSDSKCHVVACGGLCMTLTDKVNCIWTGG